MLSYWKKPRIWRFVTVASCLDTAYRLAAAGHMRIWDSVQVTSQTAGRGQLRRQWCSPPGNIYVALRLPLSPPFDTMAASPAIGFLLAEALERMGWYPQLKWPNDIVLRSSDGPRKVAGILLEERNGILLAGIGINVASAPSDASLREGAAFSATSLSHVCPGQGLLPEELWQELVNHIFSAYSLHWFDMETYQDRFLLWRGCEVELSEAGQAVSGTLVGLSPNGALCLRNGCGYEEWLSGSLSLLEHTR